MTQSENFYRQDVVLEDLRHSNDRRQQRIWAEHSRSALFFVRGLTSSSTVDLGCGPLRLGSALIPQLKDGITGRTSIPGPLTTESVSPSGISVHAPARSLPQINLTSVS